MPSCASSASTRPSQTTAAWPMSRRADGAGGLQRPRDVGEMVAAGDMPPERARGQGQALHDLVAPSTAKPSFSNSRIRNAAGRRRPCARRRSRPAGPPGRAGRASAPQVRAIDLAGETDRLAARARRALTPFAEFGEPGFDAVERGQLGAGEALQPDHEQRPADSAAVAGEADRKRAAAGDQAELASSHRQISRCGRRERPAGVGADEVDDLHHLRRRGEGRGGVVQPLLEGAFLGEQQCGRRRAGC